jgi:hypothetical protein
VHAMLCSAFVNLSSYREVRRVKFAAAVVIGFSLRTVFALTTALLSEQESSNHIAHIFSRTSVSFTKTAGDHGSSLPSRAVQAGG